MIVELEDKTPSTFYTRKVMEELTDLCKEESTVQMVAKKMKTNDFLSKIKGITISDIVNFGTTTVSVATTIATMI